ncbi:outer membrane protein [Helicobacter bizzozeronii]|nr:outer membrane protein [Helicobacter bizzozeronii]
MIGGLCACVYLSSLSAEDNGLYVQGGFEYSNFSGKQIKSETSYTFPKDGQPCFVGNGQPLPGSSTMCIYKGSANIYAYNGNLYGADIQFGYKQFFGNSKHFGLRYYGMFSGQGGVFSSINGNIVNQLSANLFYGVGIDALFNFYERDKRTFGLFAGVMVGGSSWLMGKSTTPDNCQWTTTNPNNKTQTCSTMNQYYAQQAQDINNPKNDMGATAKFSPTFVQFIFNVGLRTNLTKHQGFEFGVRIPTIDDPYLSIKSTKNDSNALGGGTGSTKTFAFRRNVSLYWNYVINF